MPNQDEYLSYEINKEADKMKVVFINHSRDKTGYGHSAEYLMEALDSVDVDVVSCWVSLTRNPKEISPKIEELEDKDLNNVDAIITYSLPQNFVRVEGVKNIGIFCCETTHFKGSNWAAQCNIMDEIWVLTPENVEACLKSGVTVPVKEINPAHNKEMYNKEYKPIKINGIEGRTVFYTISEISYRKGVTALINAYYCAFTNQDPVALVIKGFMDGVSEKECRKEFRKSIDIIRAEVKREQHLGYPPVILISEWLTDEQIMSIHELGDCYVSCSKGEAENMPLFDAAAYGNPCIAPNWNGPSKMLNDTHHQLLDVRERPVIGMSHSYSHLYLPDETWFEPDPMHVVDALRAAHIFKDGIKENAQKDKGEIQERYSYENSGNLMKNMLEELIYEPAISNN